MRQPRPIPAYSRQWSICWPTWAFSPGRCSPALSPRQAPPITSHRLPSSPCHQRRPLAPRSRSRGRPPTRAAGSLPVSRSRPTMGRAGIRRRAMRTGHIHGRRRWRAAIRSDHGPSTTASTLRPLRRDARSPSPGRATRLSSARRRRLSSTPTIRRLLNSGSNFRPPRQAPSLAFAFTKAVRIPARIPVRSGRAPVHGLRPSPSRTKLPAAGRSPIFRAR